MEPDSTLLKAEQIAKAFPLPAGGSVLATAERP